MKTYSIFSLLILLILLTSIDNLQSQTIEPAKKNFNGFFGISFTNSVPQGEFQDNIKSTGQGLSVYFGYDTHPLPFVFGLEGDILFYGNDQKTQSHSWVDPYNVTHYYRDTMEVQNMVIPINVFARIQPSIHDIVYPYAEAFLGLTILSTSLDYSTGFNYEGVEYNDSQSKINASFSYGIGVGAMIKVFEAHNELNDFQILIDLKARLVKGGEAAYWRGNIVNGKVKLDEFDSKNDMILTHFGVTFRF